MQEAIGFAVEGKVKATVHSAKLEDINEVLAQMKKGEIEEKTGKENYGSEKAKLFPTNMGLVVNDFLVEYFEGIVDYKFTANVEKEFDEIANGKMGWQDMIQNFYGDFHRNVETVQGAALTGSKPGSRDLGIHPESGKKVSARLGKYGAYVQIGEATDEDKPQFANLKKDQLIETISLEDALDLFSLPREVGFFEDKPMVIGIGKFGPYVRHDDKYVSLSKDDDPYTITAERTVELIQQKRVENISESIGEFEGKLISTGKGRFGPYVKHDDKYISLPKGESPAGLTLERAIELIQAKRLTESNKYIKEFPENPAVKVVNGMYGPYISIGKRNVKIPKDVEPATLTLEDCLKLAGDTGGEEKPKAKKVTKAPATRPAAAKKTAVKKK